MGANKPLASEYLGPVTHVHGHDGQGDSNLPEPSGSPINVGAPEWIYRMASEAPNELTILTLGPLTNLAMAVKEFPDLPNLVKEVVVMGGNALVPGNASPAAEANMLNDPEAADLVFAQPWHTTMIGLDVTHSVNLTSDQLKIITESKTAQAQHLAAAVPLYQSFFEQTNGIDGIFSHDPTAVMYLVEPNLFEFQSWPLRVETDGFSRGKTWPSMGDTDDAAPAPWLNRPTTSVATTVNGEVVARLIVQRLSQQ